MFYHSRQAWSPLYDRCSRFILDELGFNWMLFFKAHLGLKLSSKTIKEISIDSNGHHLK
jgi:hypothetical protein